MLTNPSSSEIFARIPFTGLRDHYLLSVIIIVDGEEWQEKV
jgi:hypothetical protein